MTVRNAVRLFVTAAATAALTLPAATAQGRAPKMTFESGGVTVPAFSSPSMWCGSDGSCLHADRISNPWGTPFQVPAYPLQGLVHFERPPTTVGAALYDVQTRRLDAEPVAVSQVDADTWALTVEGPYDEVRKLGIGASYAETGEPSAEWGWIDGLLRLAPPGGERAPSVGPLTDERCAVRPRPSVLRLVRGKRLLVAQVETNVPGELRVLVRQGGVRRVWRRALLPVWRHRVTVPLPQPDGPPVTVGVRLRSCGGEVASQRDVLDKPLG